MRRLLTRALLLIGLIAAVLLSPSACGHARSASLVSIGICATGT